MVRPFLAVKSLVAVAWITSSLALGTARAEETKIAGASSVKVIIDKAIVAFQKDHADARFVVGSSMSSVGVKLAGTGEVHIGMSARELNAQEQAQYPDLVPVPIGLDGTALLVNAENPVKQITQQQIAAALTGKVRNWKEFGGNDAPIVCYSVREGNSRLDAICKYCGLEAKGTGNKMAYREKGAAEFSAVNTAAFATNQEILARVINDPQALGYASLGMAMGMVAKGASIKILDVDGIAATVANVKNGSYKLQSKFFVITKSQPTGLAKEFVAFLTGPAGQKAVVESGYISAQ